jgi:hypothetical protein
LVHSGFSLKSGTVPTEIMAASLDAPLEPVFNSADLRAYPNPFTERVRFDFVSPGSVYAQIDTYDMIGRKIATVFKGAIEEGVTNTVEFIPQSIEGGMYTFRATLGTKVFTGKVLHKK